MRNGSIADSSRVGAVDRAMVLLRLLVERGELGVTEAAAELGVAASTAHRLLATMTDHGFVAQSSSRRYRPGALLQSQPGDAVRTTAQLATVLRPVVQDLFDAVGETVHVMVLVGADTQFIDGIEGPQALRVSSRIGARIPAYCTSGGKAILAELDDRSLGEMYSGGLRPWPGTRIRTLQELRLELAEVRAAHVAFNRGESELGVRALGVAVCDQPGHPVAAITVAVPAERFSQSDQRHIVLELLKAQSRAIALV